MMEIVYAQESLPKVINKSLFLAGPTCRDEDGNPWRKEAVEILKKSGYDGVVYIPEPRDGSWAKNYDDQIEWEELCLNQADCIVFWIPRDLKTMPAFTTNIEWGKWEDSGKVVLGYPKDAEKMRYLHHYAEEFKVSISSTLEDTLTDAIKFIGEGVDRTGGERMVPLYIWNTPQFQSWYTAQVDAGNRLDDAKVLFNFRPGFKKFVFLWVLHVDMYISSEDRHKTNEFVLARTDISSVVLWKPAEAVEDSEIVLVREFRSPANTPTGFILEPPGGSAIDETDATEIAAEEVFEETGMHISPNRLVSRGARQLAGTLSSHKSHLFSVKITDEELTWLKSQRDIAHGNVEDSERTYIEVHVLKDLLKEKLTDWVTIGQVLSVVMENNE